MSPLPSRKIFSRTVRKLFLRREDRPQARPVVGEFQSHAQLALDAAVVHPAPVAPERKRHRRHLLGGLVERDRRRRFHAQNFAGERHHVGRRGRLVVANVVDGARVGARHGGPEDGRDVVHVDAREQVTGLVDAPRLAGAHRVERAAPGAVDAGQAEDVHRHAGGAPQVQPAAFGRGAAAAVFRRRVDGGALVHRSAARVPVDAGAGQVSGPGQPLHRRDGAGVAGEHGIAFRVGGDGTHNEVVNGFFENSKQINPEASLGIISMGTGGDLVRTLGIPKNVEDAATKIKDHKTQKFDLGFMRCQSLKGEPVTRYFINVADAGFGGTLTNLSYQSTKVFGATATYLIALLKTLFVHETTPVKIQVDDSFTKEQIIRSIVIANGQYFGGGMWIAPQAKTNDGLFDIIILGDLTRGEVLANIHKLYNGTMAEHEKVQTLHGRKVSLNSKSEILIETDGELPGKLPASFEMVPSVLNVIC